MEPVECLPKPGGMLKTVSDVVHATWTLKHDGCAQVDQSVRSRHVDTESLNGGEACNLAILFEGGPSMAYAHMKYMYVYMYIWNLYYIFMICTLDILHMYIG